MLNRFALAAGIATLALGMAGWCRAGIAAPPPGYRLAWHDEFKAAPGSAPNAAVWSFDDGPTYNGEQEHYVSDRKHCRIVADPKASDRSALAITATKDSSGEYQSARINTLGKYDVQYGYIEARCKLPTGQGMWPAFWMLGDNIKQVGWPKCGEIDIMENIGKEPTINHGSIHGPGYIGSIIGSEYTLPGGAKLSDGYHTYGLLWTPDKVVFSVDGKPYETRTPADLPSGATWAFNGHPFYFILNVAVGGEWPGSPDATTVFPQTLYVDYIRVYQPKRR